MKTTKKHFELFVKECKKWVKFLELSRYDIHYYWKSSKGSEWRSAGNRVWKDGNADIFFDTEWEFDDTTIKEIKASAKHEVIHILLGAMKNDIESRYITVQQAYLNEEEVVRLLCKKLKI